VLNNTNRLCRLQLKFETDRSLARELLKFITICKLVSVSEEALVNALKRKLGNFIELLEN